MLKILIFDTNYVPKIARIIVLTKIRYWQKKGCRMTVFGTKEAENFYRSQIEGLDYFSLDYVYHIKNPYQLIREVLKINILALFKIRELLGKFDIIYSQSSVIDFLFIPWVIKFFDRRARWFVMVDNLVPSPGKRPGSYWQQLFPYWAFLLGNLLLRRADGVFTVTDGIKNYYRKLGMKNVIKINDGYGIDIEIFQGEIEKNTLKLNALYCGRLHLAKGIMDLVDVVNLIAQKKPDFKIGILGDGSAEIKNKFYRKIQELGLQNNFLHFGFIEGKKKADILRNCGFYLFLSYDESFGHSVLEALACNKPVIAYDLPVYHEVFGKYIASGQLKLFRKKDYNSVTNHILKEEFKQLKFNNRLENYGWETICRKELENFT